MVQLKNINKCHFEEFLALPKNCIAGTKKFGNYLSEVSNLQN